MNYIKTFENYNLGREEFIEIINPLNGNSFVCKAKIDTETYTSNIDVELAEILGLVPEENTKRVYNYLGDQELKVARVDIIFSTGESKGRRVSTYVTIADRSKLDHPIAVGRKDIGSLNLLIDVNKSI